MQHIHTPALPFDGHNNVWRTIGYISIALAGIIAVFEHSPGLLIILAVVFVMVLALSERTRKLPGMSHLATHDSTSRLFGDGGSFPDAEPEKEQKEAAVPRVLDGGSL